MRILAIATAALLASGGPSLAQQSTQSSEGSTMKGQEVQETSPVASRSKKVETTGTVSDRCREQNGEQPTKMGGTEPTRKDEC